MKNNRRYLSKEDQVYFSKYWSEYSKGNQMPFDTFKEIINSNKKIDKTIAGNVLKDIKTALDKKSGGQPVNIKQDDYYNYIEQIKREQDQEYNSNDPEMKILFENLAGPEQDYVYKKKLSDIINVFELNIDLNEFFAPIKGQEEINFNEFCSLFTTNTALESQALQTFYSMFNNLDEEERKEEIELRSIKFPVNYVPH
jgi:hypothetical protein